MMGLQALFFYIFASVAILAAFMVITVRNPVHSVLFLILTFFNAAGLFLLTGAEFLAMILLVVYVGAVAVLFLFVVMMLDIDFAELKRGALEYAPIGALIGLILMVELIIVFGANIIDVHSNTNSGGGGAAPTPDMAQRSNTEALGDILYTDYIAYFQIAGLILLVAMIGAIVLTLHHKPGIKRQNISRQVARRPETAVEIVNVKPGQGL